MYPPKSLNRGVRPLAAAGRPSARNYEALSKTCYNSVRILNFCLKFVQYILNILYFQIKQKKNFDFSNPSYQTITLICLSSRLVYLFLVNIFQRERRDIRITLYLLTLQINQVYTEKNNLLNQQN